MNLKERSQKWWAEVKANPEKFNEWLQKQYRGEVTAAQRIVKFAEGFAGSAPRGQRATLLRIATEENQHALWVLDLLEARGIRPAKVDQAEDRYWDDTLPGITSFETGCGVAAHAEAMRLARIETIVEDPEAPEDVREVFTKILKDERFHEAAFRSFAGEDAMITTAGNHEVGLRALGLSE